MADLLEKSPKDGKMTIRPIARIRADFPSKFGIPRQSGLVKQLVADIIFEKPFRDREALRGLEDYSHLWLIWGFSENLRAGWSPTVRPPRLGGNVRKGVFATRSPFRPNALGLSAVKLEKITQDPCYGTILTVSGADLMDGTPIYDLKPYLPYVDCLTDAKGGFEEQAAGYSLKVQADPQRLEVLSPPRREALLEVLRQDPRPAYQEDPGRIYGFRFSGYEVRFTVSEDCLTLLELTPEPGPAESPEK